MVFFGQRVPLDNLPVVNSTPFFQNLTSSLGDAMDRYAAGGLVKSSLQNMPQTGMYSSAQQQPNGYAQPAVQQSPYPTQTQTAPVAPVTRGQDQGSTFAPFMNTVQNGYTAPNGVKVAGLTNPYGLAAVAATGRSESGWDSGKAAGSWSDPSQSGQPGTSGGVLSLRNDRLQALRNYASSKGEQGNGSPQTQAEFFLQENPQVTAQLQNAKSPQDAANIMANAWQFAGYNQPGGEAARRQALTQNYYATTYANGNARPASNEVASLDPSIGIPMPGAAREMARTAPSVPTDNSGQNPATMTPAQMNSALGPAPQPGYVDPVVTTSGRDAQSAPAVTAAPNQQFLTQGNSQAQPGPQTIAPGTPTYVQQMADPDTIRRMVQNPLTQQMGLALWQQAATGRNIQPWAFQKLDDGTLVRTNAATGEVQTLGQFRNGNFEMAKDAADMPLGSFNKYTGQLQPFNGQAGGMSMPGLPSGVKPTEMYNNWRVAQASGDPRDFQTYQADIIKQGQQTVNIAGETEAAKKLGGARADNINSYAEAGKEARDKLQTLGVMADALNNSNGNITTGPGAETALKAKQVLQNLGFIAPGSTDPTEVFKKMGAYLASAAAKDLAQRPTQFDFKTFLQNNPGLDISTQGNQTMINILQQQAQHQADLSRMAYAYKGDPANWNDVVAEYDKTHPIISPYSGKPLDPSEKLFPAQGGQPQQQQQSAPSAMPTATAPDGRRVQWNGNAWVPMGAPANPNDNSNIGRVPTGM